MLISILHRGTGVALAIGGGLLLIGWLFAIASGASTYASFLDCVTSDSGGLSPLPLLILIGLTWTFFQHLASGIRHLVLDTGAGYELRTNKRWAVMTLVFSFSITTVIWAMILVRQ